MARRMHLPPPRGAGEVRLVPERGRTVTSRTPGTRGRRLWEEKQTTAPRAMVSIPIRLLNFRRMAAGIPGGDPNGMGWIVRELWKRWPAVKRGTPPGNGYVRKSS